jgi:pSer/pThr/pTyr-binding forkhead associated (FHA) protein
MRQLAAALEAICQPSAPVPPSGGPRLGLRVMGTPFAYRPAPGQGVITLGRQRRRPGEPTDVGNDIVLRVPDNDVLSGRISRRHLEIRRQGDLFVVVDRSRAGTLLNGQTLERDEATQLAAGDRLLIAGVVTLEVDLEGAPARKASVQEVTVPTKGGKEGRVVLEATLGDMVTRE